MLLEQGYGTQEANWFVDEKKGPGFCRVYYLESGIVFFHDEAGLQQLTSFFNEEKLLPQPAAAEWTDYLQTHACENEAIYQIANRFGYTAEHFIRQFHEKTGMSPCQYRIHCRLNHAIGRLAAGASISDIAQELGYAESKSFSRAFRTHYGVSPQEYRKRRHAQP